MRGTGICGGLAAAVLALPVPARAYIEALYPIQQVLAESEIAAEGRVEKADAANRVAVLDVGRVLKGRNPPAKIRINVGVGREWHPEALMRHLVPGAPVVVFLKADASARVGMVYLNRFFFQLHGDPAAPPDKLWWNFTTIEIRMNRTFHGTPEELSKLLRNVLAGKVKPPPPDPRMPPIRRQDITGLPTWGDSMAVEEKDLPLPFRPRPPLRPRDPENPDGLAPGIRYDFYEGGDGKKLPDFGVLTPKKTGVLEAVNLPPEISAAGNALRFTGYLEIAREGVYLFFLASDGFSRLFLGDSETVTNEGLDRVQESVGDAFLKAGRHALRLEYAAGDGEKRCLRLEFEGPGIGRRPVPGTALFHKP